jgi:hypothetical protein
VDLLRVAQELLDGLGNLLQSGFVRPPYNKQLGAFLEIFNILRKKGEINFKIGGIG